MGAQGWRRHLTGPGRARRWHRGTRQVIVAVVAARGRASLGGDIARLWLAVAGVVALILAGFFLAVVAPGLGSNAPVAPWREDVTLAASAVMLICLVAGLVSLRRAGMLDLRGWPGVWSLGRSQRRRAVRAVRTGRAAEPEDARAAVVVATALHRQGAGWLIYAGLAVNGVGQLVSVRGPWVSALLAVVVVLLVPAVVVIRRDGHRARAWLADHPPHAGAGGAVGER